jgi:transposase-like protein
MDHHLAGEELGNRRNGYGKKTVVTDTGKIELEVPRDRQTSFDPQLSPSTSAGFRVSMTRSSRCTRAA